MIRGRPPSRHVPVLGQFPSPHGFHHRETEKTKSSKGLCYLRLLCGALLATRFIAAQLTYCSRSIRRFGETGL
jgi:hypothetical protein